MVAAALTAATTVPAAAVTVHGSAIVGEGSGELTFEDGFGFDWDATPFAGYFDFSSNRAFDLSLTNYSANNDGSTREVSGFTLDRFDDTFDGSSTRLTTDTDNCESAAAPVGGECNMVGRVGSTVAIPGDTLFSDLSAGNYRLGFFDSQNPTAGYAEFNANVSPVPLPAGGFLLVGAMGGLAALKRRRKAA